MSSRTPCRNFASTGHCSFGERCHFSHQVLATSKPVMVFSSDLESKNDEIFAFYIANRLPLWREIIQAVLCAYSVLQQPEEDVAMAFEFLAKLHEDHILVHWATDVLANPTGWFREICGNDVVPEHCIRLSVWLAALVYHYPLLEATMSQEKAIVKMRQIHEKLEDQIAADCSIEDARDEEAGFHAPE